MDKSRTAIVRAKITFFFKETFRAHSMAEYREIFSRGLNDDNSGVTGAFPWLYVRAFFALFILFTVNTLVLRLTGNTLYVPSVIFLGGITFTIPFIVLLYELYPKRDLSLFLLISILIVCGTVAGVLTQIGYTFINVENLWLGAVVTGVLEELCKAIPAILAIAFTRQKNPYACFLIGAAVGAGFSIVEDMGYIFNYSENYVYYYNSNIQAITSIFIDRGLSAFCTHVLWTGAIGWAYGIAKRPFRSVWLIITVVSIGLHISWDLPVEGWLQGFIIALCVIIAAAINIAIVHKSRINTLADEVDLTYLNEVIIREAKEMGGQLRFRNAANLTLALTCTMLSVIILLLCSLPIGMDYQHINFDNKEKFVSYIQCGYDLKVDRDREYDPAADSDNNVEMVILEGELSYVIQKERTDGYDYYYSYYLKDGKGKLDNVSVQLEIDGSYNLIGSTEYDFGGESIWAFDICADSLIDYTYNKDGTVTAVTDDYEFSGYNILIALCATAVGIAAGSTIVLIALAITLRKVRITEEKNKDER